MVEVEVVVVVVMVGGSCCNYYAYGRKLIVGILFLFNRKYYCIASDRCGHGLESTVLAEERSPVFLQFLDALWQLLQQFPTSFEYNESLLLFLADHQHSALFGNFLCNYSRERMEMGLVGNTQSIWAYVLQRKNDFSQKVRTIL